MKSMHLLIWLTQLGLSVALPPTGLILLAVWLHQRQQWGSWVIWAAIVLGLVCAADGFRVCMKAMSRLSGEKGNEESTGVSFNDHD